MIYVSFILFHASKLGSPNYECPQQCLAKIQGSTTYHNVFVTIYLQYSNIGVLLDKATCTQLSSLITRYHMLCIYKYCPVFGEQLLE